MRIDPSRLAFERDDRGRNISNFTLVGFCVDAREQLVGRFSNAMRLTLNDDRLAAVKRDGIAASADVPVTGHAVRVKIVAYDDATDSLGSVIAAVK